MSVADILVVCAYAAAVLWVGLRSARGHASGADLLLGRRRLPVWAVLGSTVATELSAATFLGVPHAAYTGDWSYLQLAFGALIGKALLARSVLPLYHRLGVVTVYGFLELRYGPRAQRASAVAFLLGRLFASGSRLFIAALAFATIAGTSVEAAILACGVVAGLYTLAGGIRAVIWTDALQGVVLLAGALALLTTLGATAEGGLSAILEWGQNRGRTQVFHLTPPFAWHDARPFLVGLVGGLFLTLATHATDHDMVQRLLTTRDGRGAARALLGSALLNFPLTLLFLAIGTGLAFHDATLAPAAVPDPEQSLASFAVTELPSGLRGLLVAGLAAATMSSLDSAICAMSATWVVDVRPGPANAQAARARRASFVTAAALMGAAVAMAAYHRALAEASGPNAPPSLVELALSSMTIVYGGLLGVFAVGLLSRRPRGDRGAPVGLLLGGLVGGLLFLHPLLLGRTVLAWPFWIPLGAAVSAGVTAWGSRRRADPDRPARGAGVSAARLALLRRSK